MICGSALFWSAVRLNLSKHAHYRSPSQAALHFVEFMMGDHDIFCFLWPFAGLVVAADARWGELVAMMPLEISLEAKIVKRGCCHIRNSSFLKICKIIGPLLCAIESCELRAVGRVVVQQIKFTRLACRIVSLQMPVNWLSLARALHSKDRPINIRRPGGEPRLFRPTL